MNLRHTRPHCHCLPFRALGTKRNTLLPWPRPQPTAQFHPHGRPPGLPAYACPARRDVRPRAAPIARPASVESSCAVAERAELAQLRREARVLRQERDILAKATAFFAKEATR
jgi:hypothetical protein